MNPLEYNYKLGSTTVSNGAPLTFDRINSAVSVLNAQNPVYVEKGQDIVIHGETFSGEDLLDLLKILPYLREDYSAALI